MTIQCETCGGIPCKEDCNGQGHVAHHMRDQLIQTAARAFADYRGLSGNCESLVRARAVDLFGSDEDVESAAKRAAFKRLARQFRSDLPAFNPKVR